MAWRGTLGTMALLFWAGHAPAVDRVALEVDEVSMLGARASGITIELDLTADAPTISVKANRLKSDALHMAFSKLSVACAEIAIREPEFACRRARVVALGGPTKAIDLQAAAGYDTTKKALS